VKKGKEGSGNESDERRDYKIAASRSIKGKARGNGWSPWYTTKGKTSVPGRTSLRKRDIFWARLVGMKLDNATQHHVGDDFFSRTGPRQTPVTKGHTVFQCKIPDDWHEAIRGGERA